MSGYSLNSSGQLVAPTKPTPVKSAAVTSAPAATATSPSTIKPASQPSIQPAQASSIYDTLGQISSRLQELQKSGSSTKKEDPKSNYVKNLMGVPKTEDYYKEARNAMNEYIQSLMPSEGEKKTQGDLDAIAASLATGLQATGDQAIPMGFITGQQQSIENRAINRTIPLEAQLKRLQSDRGATSEGLLAKYGLETSLADASRSDARYADEVARAEATSLAEAETAAEELALKKQQLEYEMGKPLVVGEGSTIYDPSTGQVLYKAPKTTAGGGSGSGSGTGSYVPGQNPSVDAWVELIQSGQAKITSVPANLKNQVATALSGGVGQKSETAITIDSLVDELLGRSTSGITGAIDQFTGGLFGSDAYTKNLYNQLKGLMSLDKRTLLKGSGAISDYEFKVLENAASALGRNLTDEDFRTVLAKLKTDLASAPADSTSGGGKMLKSPSGEMFDASALTPEEYKEALADGYKPA